MLNFFTEVALVCSHCCTDQKLLWFEAIVALITSSPLLSTKIEISIFRNINYEHVKITIILPTFDNIIALPKAVAQTCSAKKVFLEISQNSQENTCARVSFLIKLRLQLY